MSATVIVIVTATENVIANGSVRRTKTAATKTATASAIVTESVIVIVGIDPVTTRTRLRSIDMTSLATETVIVIEQSR